MGSCKYTQELITDNSFNLRLYKPLNDGSGNIFTPCFQDTPDFSYSNYFKSFVPFNGPTYTSSMKGNTINADGSCCYIIAGKDDVAKLSSEMKGVKNTNDMCTLVINDSFAKSDKTLDTFKTVGIYNSSNKEDPLMGGENKDGDNVYICGKSSKNALENLAGGLDNEVSNNIGGFKALILIVIGVFLSTLGYIIFILTPFFYWVSKSRFTEHPKTDDCYKGQSLLDRYYPDDPNQYPYKFNPNCIVPVNLFASKKFCTTDDTLEMLAKESIQSSATWSSITNGIQRFPYSLINCKGDKGEEKIQYYNGEPTFLFALAISIITATSMGAKTDLGGKIALTLLIPGITWIINRLFLPYLRVRYEPDLRKNVFTWWGSLKRLAYPTDEFRKGGKNQVFDWVSVIVLGVSIFGLGLSCFFTHKNDDMASKIISIIFGIIIVLLYSFTGANDKGENPKNYNDNFVGLFSKIFYNILKRIVIIFRESTRISRTFIKFPLDKIGKIIQVGIPGNWFITVFGIILLPIFTIILFSIRAIGSIGGGLFSGEYQLYTPEEEGGAYCGQPSNKKIRLRLSSIPWWLTGMPFTITFISTLINMIFFFFSYHIIPYLGGFDFLKEVIQCNIKSIIFIFGLKILSILWAFHAHGTDYVPHEALVWMTVTFFVVVIWNFFQK